MRVERSRTPGIMEKSTSRRAVGDGRRRSETDMAERIHKSKQGTPRPPDSTADSLSAGSGEKLKAELDDLLDEIDEVLEANAEDFVKSYVQKGGE